MSLSLRSIHTSTNSTRDHLRTLLRETAQSVAVITALLHGPSSLAFHGATLSSFTSIALDPHPLVAFSLRVPSRMASALNAHARSPHQFASHFVINILSAAQPHLADRFARPDLHPHPFDTDGSDSAANSARRVVAYTTTQDGLPVLAGVLGALSCRLVGSSLALARLRDSESEWHALGDEGVKTEAEGKGENEMSEGSTGQASELFIARVLRVEHVPIDEQGRDSELYKLPLVYHQRRYTTIADHANSDS